MIARFEDTRDIRLLGAYQAGADAELDMAVRQVPLIYEALTQSPKDRPSYDPFADLARHLKSREKPNGVLQAPVRARSRDEMRPVPCRASRNGPLLAARQAEPAHRRRAREGDTAAATWSIAALGIALGLICALLPLVHLLQPGKVRRARHEIRGQRRRHRAARAVGPQPQRIGAPMTRRGHPVDAARPVRDRHAARTMRQRQRQGHARPRPSSLSPADVAAVPAGSCRQRPRHDRGRRRPVGRAAPARCCPIPAASPASRSATANGCWSPRRTGSSN